MSAIAATFSDFRPVKSRGVYQIILEVPAENANAVLIALGGVPVFGSEQWVGVAPLKAKPEPKPEKVEEAPTPPAPVEKERRPFHTLPRSQQAAIMLQTEGFRRWWNKGEDSLVEHVDVSLKEHLGIRSKRELDAAGSPAFAWDGVLLHYRHETGQTTWERPS